MTVTRIINTHTDVIVWSTESEKNDGGCADGQDAREFVRSLDFDDRNVNALIGFSARELEMACYYRDHRGYLVEFLRTDFGYIADEVDEAAGRMSRWHGGSPRERLEWLTS